MEIVKTRNIAILKALKVAPMTRAGLQFQMPDEPWSSQDEREEALDSTLLRLRIKKEIVEIEGVWRLVE